jgi:hypothetical protein
MVRFTRFVIAIGGTFALALCAAFTAGSQASAQTAQFRSGFETSGTNGGVYAMAVFDDGGGPKLHAAGEFDAAGAAVAGRIAKWNALTQTWTSLGQGIDGRAGSMVVFDEDGNGPLPPRLFVAGTFTTAGGSPAANIARWNGTAWSPVGGGTEDLIAALAVFDDDGPGPHPAALYAGGLFAHAGGLPASSIARWNGSTWQPLAGGLDGAVTSLAVFDDDGPGPHLAELYAGGTFTHAGGVSANHLARWNGQTWQRAGSGVDGSESVVTVNAMAVFDEDGAGPNPPRLFVGGSFVTAGGIPVNGIARWNGQVFSPLANGITAAGSFPNIRALSVFDDGSGPKLCAAGLFRTAGGASAIPDAFNPNPLLVVARWDGATWTSLGAGLADNSNSLGRSLLAFDDDNNGIPSLFVGGFFTTAGPGAAAGVARWSGTSWQPLGHGQGLNGDVNAMVAAPGTSGTLVVGGSFTTAGQALANRVALWQDAGSSFTPLGVGVDGAVRAVEFHNSGLYAGGDFTSSGGQPARHVAQFNGSSWTGVGGGTDGHVLALKSFQGRLYAGGSFKTAGNAQAGNVAAWDGVQWTPLFGGTDATVRALAIFDEGSGPSLFVGGEFTRAGSLAVSGVARWNGVSWSAVGNGLCCDGVHAFAVYDDGAGPKLYAAGDFDLTGTQRVDGVARWNVATQRWQPVGTGFSGGSPTLVNALSAVHLGGIPYLVAGGEFEIAGGIAAKNIARWNGTSWSAFGAGTNGDVSALGSLQVQLGGEAFFVGGNFTQADGRPSARIARSN